MWIQLGVTSRRCGHPCPVYAMHRAKGMQSSTFYLNFIQSLILNTLIFCLTLQDGMYTLSMAVESEFNLSCPALSLSIPIDTPDLVYENEHISIPHALTSTTPPATITATTKTTPARQTPARHSTTSTSSIQKLQTPLLPYYILGQPDFKPVPPSYPLLLFPPNIAPMILPQSPKIVGPPTAITQRPQAPVYTKHPQTWYPSWPLYPRKPLLPPTKAPTAPIAPLLKPTDSPQDELQWATMFPPSEMVYPLYPGKPEFVTPSSVVFPQLPHWPHHFQTQQRPSEPHAPPNPELETPTPAPTRKTGPQLLRYPWYKPFLPHRSKMPPVPKNKMVSTSGAVASRSTTYSERSEQIEKPQASELPYGTVVKGPPMSLYFDLTPNTYPTPSLPKFPEVVHTPAPIEASPTPISSSHAHSFHCPAFCPGPPSMFSHHNHHHFGHPLQMSNFVISSTTEITGQMLSSPVISPDSNLFPLIKGNGYNYGPLYTKTALPPASDHTAMQYLVENPPIKSTDAPDISKHFTGPTMRPYIFRKLESTAASPQPTMKPANFASVIRHLEHSQNRPVAEPLAYSNHSPNPAVNQAEMQQYVYPMGLDTQSMLVAPNNVPSFEEMVQHYISSKPTMPPTHDKNAFMNYWHQAANLNAKPSRSNSLTKDSFTQMSLLKPPNNHNPFEPSTASIQPEETPDENPPPQSFHPLIQIRDSEQVKNPQLYFPPNGESVDPVFRGPKLFNMHWVPAVQSNKGALISSSQTDGRWISSRCTINWPK